MLKATLSTFAVVCVAIILSSAAYAAEHFYDHNGSRMLVNVQGAQIRITYDEPRPGLRSVGVAPGTLLFEGHVANGSLDGLSRIFNANCGPVDYFVYGDFRLGQSFVLTGTAPVLSNANCRVVDSAYQGENANLLFTAVNNRTGPRR